MQTLNLIIPMAGKGKRFVDKSYTKYKTLLEVDKYNTVYDKLISNFNHKSIRIILILNNETYLKDKNKFKKKNVTIIKIKNHNNGPLYSLRVVADELNKLIKQDQGIFISYSDINWTWDIKKVLNYIKDVNACVFTHTGFHPHLEVNTKSDFCKIKNGGLELITQKKKITKDYKLDHLAIGCYYFKKIRYLNNFFSENKYINIKKEYYVLSLVNYLIKNKIKVTNYNIRHFVHLGTPEQYEDFISWRNELSQKNNYYLGKNKFFKKNSCVMLMAGQGKRLKKINSKKFLLQYKNESIFKHILNLYQSKKNIIITNSNLKKELPKNLNLDFYFVKKNNSMFKTISDSSKFLINENKFFLTSCDCYGKFNFNTLKKKLEKTKADMCMFGFSFSNLQKKLNNAHTQLLIKEDKVIDIRVKKNFKENLLGHGGFFWINNGRVFNYIPNFLSSTYYKSLRREVIIDDYFKFIIKANLIKVSIIKLKNYVHIGSLEEYNEYLYWEKYFKNAKIK